MRSFRTVFDLERRIYRVDRLRLNPGGVPVRGCAYFIAIALALAVAASLPLIGWPIARLPWYVRAVGLPAALAAVLTIVRVDGRPFHVAARALGRFAAGSRYLAGFQPCPPPGAVWRPAAIVFVPDGSEPRLRAFRYTGPGSVLALRAHERIEWRRRALDRRLARPRLTLRATGGGRLERGEVIALPAGVTLEVRPARVARS